MFEQLLGPLQHPVAPLEHRVDPARAELRLPPRPHRSEQRRRLNLLHSLRAVRDSPAVRSW